MSKNPIPEKLERSFGACLHLWFFWYAKKLPKKTLKEFQSFPTGNRPDPLEISGALNWIRRPASTSWKICAAWQLLGPSIGLKFGEIHTENHRNTWDSTKLIFVQQKKAEKTWITLTIVYGGGSFCWPRVVGSNKVYLGELHLFLQGLAICHPHTSEKETSWITLHFQPWRWYVSKPVKK